MPYDSATVLFANKIKLPLTGPTGVGGPAGIVSFTVIVLLFLSIPIIVPAMTGVFHATNVYITAPILTMLPIG